MQTNDYSGFQKLNLASGTYILVLPGWYPTWQDLFKGDFNHRHVKAAGLYTAQVVLYIAKDLTRRMDQMEIRFQQVSENIVEVIVIYPEKKNKAFDTFHSNLRYIQ